MTPADHPLNEAETEASVPPAPEAQTAEAPPAVASEAGADVAGHIGPHGAPDETAPDAGHDDQSQAAADAAHDDASHAGYDAASQPAVDAASQMRPGSASETRPDAAADAGPRLKALFPALFVGAAKPIKLRIQQDIQARAPGAFTRQSLSTFFRRYTGSTAYLHAVANGRERFDLDGQPAGPIADEHRQAAREELARRRARHEERRALEEQQRRNRAGLLRDYERTTLTRANFCALKQIDEVELDRVLAIAREEAVQSRAAPPDRLPGRQPQPRGEANRPDNTHESQRRTPHRPRAGGPAPGRQGRG